MPRPENIVGWVRHSGSATRPSLLNRACCTKAWAPDVWILSGHPSPPIPPQRLKMLATRTSKSRYVALRDRRVTDRADTRDVSRTQDKHGAVVGETDPRELLAKAQAGVSAHPHCTGA